jgi:hypothetical protein
MVKQFYSNYSAIVITPSLSANESFEEAGMKIIPLKGKLMESIRDAIDIFKSTGNQFNLIILDDCVSQLKGMNTTDKKDWIDLLYNGRHLLGDGKIISTWMTSQYFRAIPKEQRTPYQGNFTSENI